MKHININSELNEYIELLNPEEITDELIELFEEFRLEDKRYKNELTRHSIDIEIEEIEYLFIKKANMQSIEDIVIDNEIQTIYEAALSTLTETEQRRFLLYTVQELSTWKIAKIEEVTQKAIRNSIFSAKEKIKKYFDKFSILGTQNKD